MVEDSKKVMRKQKPTQKQAVQFDDDQVRQVQEAILLSERDMERWCEQARVDPEKLKEPLAW